MKNYILTILLVLLTTLTFASNDINTANEYKYTEYIVITNDAGIDTCYVRACWNPTPDTKRCTDWVEVPCDVKITMEVKKVE